MARPASSYDLVDTAKRGRLADELCALRGEGLTIDEITAHFHGEGYSVSRETIRRWCHQAGAIERAS